MTEFDSLHGQRMSDAQIDQLLLDEGVGVLSMADEGVPYGIPMSFGYDGDDRLYVLFAGHSEAGRKVSYAERSELVSFLAYDVESAGEWRSAVVSGPFERIVPDEWERAREAMADNAFRPQLLAGVNAAENPRVWALRVEDKSGRAVGL